jgi:hypothetical protein
MIILGMLCARTGNSERLMWENKTLKNNLFDIIIHCLCGKCWGPDEMNDNCENTIHMGMIDRGFTVLVLTFDV